DRDFEPWRASLNVALETGANFSGALPLTSPDAANARGQQYQGPVALITDPLCYSATDTFTAGFQDHEIGSLISVGGNTGAGGASVWTHERLRSLLEAPEPDPDSPYVPLPKGAQITVAMRRTLRVGKRSGTPIEDLGVVGERYWLTCDDILSRNRDLLEFA